MNMFFPSDSSWMSRMSTIDPSISCASCGGNVCLNSNSCKYCGTKYDRDLARIKFGTEETKSGRECPDCNSGLTSIDIEIGGRFLIERCGECFGVFLDPLELEEFFERIYNHHGPISTIRLSELSENTKISKVVRYRKCPVCSSFMARRNFGHRSGVIMDICRKHGTWLDAGELQQLIRWSKAGGQSATCNLKSLADKRWQQAMKREKEGRIKYGR